MAATTCGHAWRPPIYTAAKWDFAIAHGVIFAVIGAAVAVTGIRYLSKNIHLPMRSRHRAQPARTPRSDIHS